MVLLPSTVLAEDTTDPSARVLFDSVRAATGLVPHYVRTFSTRPDVYDAWRGLVGAIARHLDHRTYEAATVGAARALRSTYCSLAHGQIVLETYADEAGLRGLLAAADSRDVSGAATRDEAVAAFAAKVATSAPEIDGEDVAALQGHGLGEQEVLDIVLAAAARCFFSTVLDATGTAADPGFRERFPPDLLDELTVGRPVALGEQEDPFTGDHPSPRRPQRA